MRTSIKRAAVVGTALAVTVGAGAAYAAWTANGSGSATAKATTVTALTTASVEVSADLYPGAKAGVVVKVVNANKFPVSVTGIGANGAITVDAAHADCNVAAAVAFTAPGVLATAVTVPAAGAASGVVSIPLAESVTMSNLANDDCQGATFTIPVSLTGASAA